MPGTKGNSGGYRPYSGRKRQEKTVSEKVKKNWMAAARKIKRETGMTIEEHGLRIVIDPEEQGSVKASILKQYNEALIVKEIKQGVSVNDRPCGPAIGSRPGFGVWLPEIRREDPALKAQKKVLDKLDV